MNKKNYNTLPEDYESGEYGESKDEIIKTVASKYLKVDVDDPTSTCSSDIESVKQALGDMFDAGRDASVTEENTLTPKREKEREKIVKGMKKSKEDLKQRYGKDWENIMYATATKKAMSEARNPDYEYSEKFVKGKLDKVILNLTNQKSSAFTKLVAPYAELKKRVDELTEQQKDLTAKIKEAAEDLFDATDVVYTKVIETASLTVNISKKTSDEKVTIDYEAIVLKLMEMVPELSGQIEKLIAAHTSVTENTKSPAMRVSIKENSLSWIKPIADFARKIKSKIMQWSAKYDSDLEELKSMANVSGSTPFTESIEFFEGYESCKKGSKKSPYKKGTKDLKEWIRGYKRAQSESLTECDNGCATDVQTEYPTVISQSYNSDKLSITSTESSDGRTDLSITARDEVADELRKLLSLSGLGSQSQVAYESKEEIDEEFANEPDEKVYDLKSILDQGNDLHRKKKQYAGKPRLGDNPKES